MQNTDPKVLALAFLGGLIPSLIWLWFWLKEEEKKPEPRSVLTGIFVLGMLSTILVLPLQQFIQKLPLSEDLHLLLWASVEEIMKFLVVMVVLYRSNQIDEPIDWPIYMITGALGFAALENMMFLIKPLSLGETTVSLLTGQLRFLGSTLLHSISSGIVGISLGLAFYFNQFVKKTYFIVGMVFAIVLHSVFNFFIIRNNGSEFLKVFAFLWVVTIVIMLMFEKLRRMS
jgi:RsiW-degrading membrane proteinase PrsW (M82 family)